MKNDEVNKKHVIEQQHRFRGLISEFRSHRFVKDRRTPRSRAFRSSLAAVLLDMRVALPRDQYRPMLEWVAETIASQVGEIAKSPIGYDSLSGVYVRAPVASLEDELVWIAERLRVERRIVEEFIAIKAEIEAKTIAGYYEEAIKYVETLQQAFGVTLWSVQLRLALEHQAGGLERQKRYSAEVRAIYRNGLLGFVTYHTSVRNEDRTTFAKFLDDIEGRITNHRYYDDATKVYARYRLKNEWPTDNTALANILRVEQSHGLIDIYETYVASLQAIASQEPSMEMAHHIVNCISIMDISDFRLIKIARLLDPAQPITLPERDHTVSNALLSGDAAKAIWAARRTLRNAKPADPWQFIYAGFALAHRRRGRTPPTPRPTTIPQMIGCVQSRCIGCKQGLCGMTADAWAAVAKLTLNFRGLPVTAAILELLHQIRRVKPDAPWRPWLIGLNSPTHGIEDYHWGQLLAASAGVSRSITAETWRAALDGKDVVQSEAARLMRVVGSIYRRDFGEAIAIFATSGATTSEPLRALRALLLLHAYHARGERQRVIHLIANEGARSPAHRQMLPVVDALKDYAWIDYKRVTEPLAAPIALHLLWSAHETSQTASQLRFATKIALQSAGVSRPSELRTATTYAHHELIYFLRHVCVPDILDVSSLFDSTHDVMEERQATCAVLQELDPQRSSLYSDEVMRISNQFMLDEGQWIVDSTRIYVDSDTFSRWAIRELSEEYNRYRDLVTVSVETTQSFEDVLREVFETGALRTTFSLDNEADAVLYSIFTRMGEEFLGNATFGLDYYLSKRVRHQSFIGLIRGPLEFSDLITTREAEGGSYHRNEVWINRFQGADEDIKDRIDDSLRNFAAKFDEILIRAKDTYFHLKSAKRPHGMIALALNEHIFSLARAYVHQCPTFEEFLPFAFLVLWSAVEPSLANMRDLIAEDIKSELIREFDLVRASIREFAGHDPAFLEFDAAMGRGAAEVQVKLDEAAQWFVHADTVASQRTFTLEQSVKISISEILKTQRGYAPEITQLTVGELDLPGSQLVFVHDVLFVGLGNVQKHSGLRNPNIDIAARWNAADSTLAIEVVSDCRASQRAEKAKRADAAREAIAAGSHLQRTRTESGSGFAKLAATVGQSEHGKLDFGFTPEGRFCLEMTYSVLVPAKEPAHVA